MPQLSPTYSRIDTLPTDASNELRSLVSDGLPEEWRYSGHDDLLWLFSVLVDEREACYIGLSRPVEDQSDCPITEILDETDLSYTVNTISGDEREWRDIFISQNPDAVETVSNHPTIPEDTTFGRLLGYPSPAIDAFEETSLKDVLSFIDSERDVGPDETRYLNLLPYVPAPTKESVQSGIQEGKRYAALPHQIAQDRPKFDELPAQCPSPPPTDDWGTHVQNLE